MTKELLRSESSRDLRTLNSEASHRHENKESMRLVADEVKNLGVDTTKTRRPLRDSPMYL